MFLVLSRNNFLSVNDISPAKQQELMKKLNKRKIRWIVKQMKRREMGAWTIAQIQGVTPRWTREVYKKYKGCKDPILLKPGRKPMPITEQERKLVIDTYKEYLVGATMIEQILDEKGIHINHSRIHRILLEEGFAKQEQRKKKRRKWIRYERKHSLSLVHSDWAEYKGWKFILIEDDASRFITGYGKFKHATAENGIKVFKKSLRWGTPKQFHSDNGSVFRANEQEGKRKGEADFEKVVREAGIKQIFTRVKHPQGNGKMEKLVGTIKILWGKLGSFEKAVEHYSCKKPHWSLNNGKTRTPYQAFLDKMWK